MTSFSHSDASTGAAVTASSAPAPAALVSTSEVYPTQHSHAELDTGVDHNTNNMPATPHTADSFSHQREQEGERGQQLRAQSPVTALSHVSSVDFSNEASRTMVDGEASTTVVHEHGHEREGGRVRLSDESVEKRISHLPSPPLTRVGTDESVRRKEEEDVAVEEKEKAQEAAGEMSDVHFHPDLDLEMGVVEGGDRDDHASSMVCAGRVDTSSPSLVRGDESQLRFNTKTPPSPPPWDVIHPQRPQASFARGYGRERERERVGPTTTTTTTTTYSPKETDRFAAMQNQMTARSLKPKSSYYFGPPPPGSAYGTRPIGRIGLHYPREILRIERDYSGGELVQFAPIFPLELEGRVTPKQFYESISAINELLASAHSLRHSFLYNLLNVVTLHLVQLFVTSHYDKEMLRLQRLFDYLNTELFNPVGLNILWPRKVAFLFLEIEYY